MEFLTITDRLALRKDLIESVGITKDGVFRVQTGSTTFEVGVEHVRPHALRTFGLRPEVKDD